jgi:hypothetical protein
MKENITLEFLMQVIKGEVTAKGQSGKESVGAAQELYLGSRFGAGLAEDPEALLKKCENLVDKFQMFTEYLQIVIDGNRAERDAAVAKKMDSNADKYKNYSVDNLDAMIIRLQALKAKKTA